VLKLNIGFNRKVGEVNYGSRGASVNLEIEVESGVVREPEKLQAKLDYLFNLAKASVDAQLNGTSQPPQPQPAANNGSSNNGSHNGANGNGTHANANANQASGNGNGNGNGSSNGNGHGSYANGNGNGSVNGNGSSNGNGSGHQASEKQINFATQLAKGIRGLGTRRLESLTGRMFGKPLAGLSSLEASSLIDTLKAIKEGRVSLDAALSEGMAA